MNTRFWGCFSFASISIALLTYQFVQPAVQQPLPVFQATTEASAPALAPVQVAAAGDNVLAFSSIVPMPMTTQVPVASMVDIAAESVWQRRSNKSENSELTKDTDVATTGQIQRRKKSIDVNGFVANKPAQIVPVHALIASHSFTPLLHSTGFKRPSWEDTEYNMDFSANETELEPFLVMLDPGHGGSDSGARGHNGLLEKDLTLDIARRVRLFLTEHKHIEVQLTRNHDHGLSRQSRVNAIKRSEADMVISLHFNHLPQSEINLVESYYAGPKNIRESLAEHRAQRSTRFQRTGSDQNSTQDLSFTDDSSRLAHTLQQYVYNEVGLDNEHVQNAGIKEETLFVLTQSFRPGVLLEISCLSHEAEADKLSSEQYRNRLAAALVDGIRHYHDHMREELLVSASDISAHKNQL